MTLRRYSISETALYSGEIPNDFDGYRRVFLFLALFFFLGELFCIYIYKYTHGLTDILTVRNNMGFDISFAVKDILLSYFNEIKYPMIVFLSGLTMFAPVFSIAFSLFRGFFYGLSLLFAILLYSNDRVSLTYLIISGIIMTLTAVLEISLASLAYVNSSGLRHAAPSFKKVFSLYSTHCYIIYTLIICSSVFILTALRYAIPNIFK